MPISSALHRTVSLPDAHRHVRSRWRRRFCLASAWLTALLLCSGLVWAITWFRPQRPVGVVLVGAGYQENLATPHNAAGWQSLQDLARLCDSGAGSDNSACENFALAGPPQTIDGDFRWREALRDTDEEALVLVVSAHGAADEDGPYLLPNDFHGSEQQRLRLGPLFDALAALPEDQEKLVLFDVTQIAGDWRLGFLHNDFARALTSFEDRIRSTPNLAVICASDVNQQSWVYEPQPRTVFLHYLTTGLQGAAKDADRDGRIDGAELHAWLKQSVSDWVAKHRGVKQEPLLLPRGRAGLSRARQIDLALAAGKAKQLPPLETAAAGADVASLPELRDAWQQYAELVEQTPSGFAYSPTRWREYIATLLRYEQLLRAGDRQSAARMHERLAGIEYRMQRDKVQAHASLQNSLSLYKVARTGELPREQATQVLNQCWSADDGELASIWQQAVQKTQAGGDGDDATGRQMLRLALFEALLERATEDPAANLARAAKIVEVVRSPLHPLPAELHFLVMLNKYLPTDALDASGAHRVARALKLRRLAERAAVGHHDGAVYACEQALPWIADQVTAADRQRQLGEDLLFAGPADRSAADAHFKAAEDGYEQALDNAERVQTAIATRDRVLALLPYYSQWLADATLDPYVANARHEATLREAEDLWQHVHELTDLLERPEARWITRVPPPTSERPQPRSLVEQSDLVRAQFDELVAQYDKIVAAMASGEATPHWHAAQRALHVPHADWRQRLALLAKAHENGRADSAQREKSSAKELAAPAMTDAAEVTAHRTSSRDAATTNAQWQGRMALATLGRRVSREVSREVAGDHPADREGDGRDAMETFDQIKHRLDVFSVEEDWWRSTMAAAEQIHARWAALPRGIDAALANLEAVDPAARRKRLSAADRWARLIDGAQASQLQSRPSVFRRRLQLQDLAIFLAGRTLDEHWYGLDPADEPYYRRAALAYLNDARRLMPGSPQVAQCRDKINRRSALAFTELHPLELTSQQRVTLDYQLQPTGGAAFKSGYPVSWLESGAGLRLVQPAAKERIVRRFGDKEQGGDVAVSIRSKPLEQAERQTAVKVGREETRLTLHGFFRGQVLEKTVPVHLHLRPEIARYEYPLPEKAAVSLSTTADVAARFGTGKGAIAFVLDCSGSMGPPQGTNDPTQSKYAEAVDALREVLQRVPRGTKISLWTFGEKTDSSGRPQSPEETIRRVQKPIAWTPDDRAQLRALMKKVDPQRLTPWNQSPIVRTILAAKEDVADAEGFKTILVITDGMDNRFAHDREANAAGKSIPQTLTAALAGTGIALNIVAFKVAGGEQQHVQDQFAMVETLFPPGRLYHVNETEKLAATLSHALGHRLRFHITPYDSDASPAALDIGRIGGSEVWPRAPLAPGAYQLQVGTTPPSQADIALQNGDVLALSLEQQDGRFVFRRRTYAQLDSQHRPQATAGRWQATLLQNQFSPGRHLRAALALENAAGSETSVLGQRTPRAVWFEAEPSADRHGGIAWGRLSGFPAPVWNITAADWPTTSDGTGLAKPKLRCWWSDGAGTPYSATLRRNGQRPTLGDLSGVVLRTADDEVRVQTVAMEDHFVEVAPGRRAKQPCLVVRLKSTPGNVYWARLQGLQTAGVEERFYPSIGSYTGLFWPATAAQVERSLQGLGIVAWDVFQREARQRGQFLELNDLPAPDAGSILPTPAYSFD